MDVSAVRSKNPQTSESLSHDAGTGTAVQGLIATFSDMLRNAGIRMESDASSLMPKAKADVTAARHDAEAAERARSSRPERRDDAAAAPAEKPRRARNGEEKARKDVTKPAEESAVSEKADRAKTPASAASEADAPARPKESAGTERPADPANAPVETAAGGETAAPQDETTVAVVETAAAPAEAAPPPSPTDFVADVLATQLFAQSAATGTDPATAAADTASAVDDLSVAVTTAGQGKTAGDAGLAAAMAASANADASASATISAAAAKTAAQPQVTPGGANAAAPQGETPVAGDAQMNAADLKIQQAAALSRLTGNGNLVAVRTTVTEPSAQLVSQPAATLSAPIAAAVADPATSAAPATAPAAQAAPLNAAVQAAVAGTEASPLAQQNQQAEAQIARAPGASVAADAAKTIVQAAGSTASAGMQTSSGGGESLAGSGAHAALQTPSTQPASHTQAAGQPRFTVAQQAAVDQVSVQISKAIKDGIDHINIQLRPQNLGRVDVRLEVTDGRVSATVTADSKETLDMLQKDARELERALQQAGLETDNGSLSFSLRGQQGQGQEGDRQVAGGRSGQEVLAADDTTAETPAWTDYPGGIRPDGRIDIRA